MRAFIAMGDVAYELMQISVEEMSGILADEKMKLVRGIPFCFDALRGVWPTPGDCTPPVVFIEDT